MLDVSDRSFKAEVLDSKLPVLVDFWAPWCQPCLKVGPVLEALESEFAGKAKFVKVNIDVNDQVASRYSILSIPALYVFRAGVQVDQLVGAASKQAIATLVKRNL